MTPGDMMEHLMLQSRGFISRSHKKRLPMSLTILIDIEKNLSTLCQLFHWRI